ncbi:MAG: hypothetical protein ACF8NJ_10435, partial [Phycisphaerales bacterium JB038]
MQMQAARKHRHPRTRLAILLLWSMAGAAGADEVCGEIDGDGDLDMSDLGLLLGDWGCQGSDCAGDVDGDGDTDQQDLAWQLIYFGCPNHFDCGPCEPLGTGTMHVDLVPIDNTSVGPGDDPLHPEFHGGVTHFTFDERVAISADNDWTTQDSFVEIVGEGVEFFQHSVGGYTEPNSALFGYAPALEFDSFFASPPELFDNGTDSFAEWPLYGPTSASAVSFDYYRYDDLEFSSQRLTLVIEEDSGTIPAV